MLWGKQESKTEQNGLQAYDYATGRTVQKKAGIGTQKAGNRSDYDTQYQQTREMICQ